MPLILLGIGAAGGFIVARGVDETASLAKWLVAGGALYVGAKAFKVI